VAAQLLLSTANVTVGDVVHEKVQIVVRGGSATLIEGKGQARHNVERREDVAAVTRGPASRGRWVVEFADGSTWDVARVLRPCGCR